MRKIKLILLFAGILFTTQSKAQPFGSIAIGGGGFVSGIITCKSQQDLIYARTDVGGAYRWDDVNSRWIPLLDWASSNETGYLGVESLAVDPSNPNYLYMSVGTSYFNNGKSAILRSRDKGNTFSITDITALFKIHGNGMGRNSGEKLVVDPNKGNILFCGSRSNGLFHSVDSGASWSRVTDLNIMTTANGNGISLVLFDPTSASSGTASQTLIVGVSRMGTTNLYRSNDGGVTFTSITGAPTALMPQRAVFANDTSIYITYANGAGPYGTTAEPMDAGQIWKYKLKTEVWTNITPSGFTRAFSGISVDPNNSKRIVASSINTYWSQGSAYGDQFFLSTNGGTSWTNIVTRGYSLNANGVTWMSSSQSIHWAGSIEFDPFNTQKVYVNSGNGLFMTDNVDAIPTVWKFNVKGLEETVPLDLVSIPSGPLISVIGDYDGFRNTDVNQYGPQNTPTMGSTNGLAYAALNPNKIVRAGSSMYYSSNMGTSWTKSTINGSQGFVSLSADGNTLLHSPASLSTTYRSINNGTSWTTVSGLGYANARTVADPVNSNKFYAYNTSSGGFYVSTNGGISFTQSTTLPTNGSKHIRTVPGYEGHIWAALYGSGLRISTNSGASFTSITNVANCDAVGIGKAAPGAIYPTIYIWGTVGGIQGLYRSINQGTSWIRVNDNDHEWGGPGNGQFVIGDMNVYGRVFMSTVGRGIVYSQLQDCNGVWGGQAFLDSCTTCVEGNTGKKACVKDCNGIWGGADTTACSKDCNGIWGGTAYKDSCATCVEGNTGKQACKKDCNGIWGGTAYQDSCSTCVGGNTGKVACTKDCSGIWGGTAFKDNCLICVGGNTGKSACTKDCFNVWGGKAYLDSCANCVGGTTGKLPCTQDCKGVWGGKAFFDTCSSCIDTSKGDKACATAVRDYKITSFSVFPNPFSKSLHLHVLNPSEYIIVKITGEIVEKGNCYSDCLVATKLLPGFYFLTIKSKNDQKTIKIVKQ